MVWEELTTFGECGEGLQDGLHQEEILRECSECLHQVAGQQERILREGPGVKGDTWILYCMLTSFDTLGVGALGS